MPLLLLGVMVGAVTPIQTAVNSRLRMAVGTPFRASLVSFTVGTLVTLVASLTLGPHPLLPASALAGPWWMWLAGLFGVIFMTGNILLLPKLGSLQTVMMPVLGQILMGLLIDEFGWFGSPQQPMTVARAIGAVLAVVGFALAIVVADLVYGGRLRPQRGVRRTEGPRADGGGDDGTGTGVQVPSRRAGCPRRYGCGAGIGMLCGMCSAVQTSILGRLGTELGSPIKASFVSFLVGLPDAAGDRAGSMTGGFGLHRAFGGGNPWWMWFGGFLGSLVVLTNSVLSPLLGTGLTVLVALLGQVIGGLLIDTFGWFAVARRRVGVVQIAGIVVAVAGIAVDPSGLAGSRAVIRATGRPAATGPASGPSADHGRPYNGSHLPSTRMADIKEDAMGHPDCVRRADTAPLNGTPTNSRGCWAPPAVPYVAVDDVSLVTADVIVVSRRGVRRRHAGLKRTMARLVNVTERIRRFPARGRPRRRGEPSTARHRGHRRTGRPGDPGQRRASARPSSTGSCRPPSRRTSNASTCAAASTTRR